MSWADVDAFLARINRLQPSNAAGLLALLETFVAANEDPGRSPNFRNQVSWLLIRETFLQPEYEGLLKCPL